MKQFRRVEPRIAYDQDVSLARVEGGRPGRPIIARAVNMSASGIYLHASEPCEIGSALLCAIPLPDGPRKLMTRVVRLESLPGTIGMALVFVGVRLPDLLALRTFVAARRARTVDAKVQLPGMSAAVRCQAVRAGDTIRLSTTLPFLRIDSEVGVLLEPNGSRESRNGILSKLTLEPMSPDGVPRLVFDVDVAPSIERPVTPSGPAPWPVGKLPLPSVMISRSLAEEVGAAAATRVDPHRTGERHDTAIVSRVRRYTDWTHPPGVLTGGPAHAQRPWSSPWSLSVALGAAALAGFVLALLLR